MSRLRLLGSECKFGGGVHGTDELSMDLGRGRAVRRWRIPTTMMVRPAAGSTCRCSARGESPKGSPQAPSWAEGSEGEKSSPNLLLPTSGCTGAVGLGGGRTPMSLASAIARLASHHYHHHATLSWEPSCRAGAGAGAGAGARVCSSRSRFGSRCSNVNHGSGSAASAIGACLWW